MITAKELADMRLCAQFIINNYPKNTISYSLALDLLKLLDEFERVNRLGTEVREVNIIYADGTGEQLWPKKETT